MDVQVGKVTHYYDKIGVAVVEVMKKALKVGANVKFSGHDNEFTQAVESLQMEHEQVKELKVGQSGGMKTDKPVKAGDAVYLAPKK